MQNDEKKINAVSTIQRALGMIEGVASGLDTRLAQALFDAAEMIDEAVKEVVE